MTETRTKADESGHLTASQERALIFLLTTTTHEAAAEQSGISTRSLRRYLRMPEFRAEYLRRRGELISQAVTLAHQHALSMVGILVDIASDADMPASVRVSAAHHVFSIADNGRKVEDLEARIAALESQVSSWNGHTTR
jgi:hypothetical protein